MRSSLRNRLPFPRRKLGAFPGDRLLRKLKYAVLLVLVIGLPALIWLQYDINKGRKQGLHFVEVKSRTAPVSAAPEENVTPLKQRRLVSAAHAYLDEKHPGDLDVYFDIVTVVFDGERTDIQYYKQAFIPIYT